MTLRTIENSRLVDGEKIDNLPDDTISELNGKEDILTAGDNIEIDRTDPDNPIISASGTGTGTGTGDVQGPETSVDENISVFDGATGKIIKDSGVNISKLIGIEAGAEVNNISDANATDLTDAGDSTLHYHSSDRSRANHTGTQLASTISDFNTAVSNNPTVAGKLSIDGTDTMTGNLSMGGNNIVGGGSGAFTGTLTATNLSGTNTGDETEASILSELGVSQILEDVVAGTNVTIDKTDPKNPTINVTGGDVVDDLTPQLGGDLDIQAQKIVGNGGTLGLEIASDGEVIFDDDFRTSDGAFIYNNGLHRLRIYQRNDLANLATQIDNTNSGGAWSLYRLGIEQVRLWATASYEFNIQNITSHDFIVHGSDDRAFVVDSGTNSVGIGGVAIPSATLDVGGDVIIAEGITQKPLSSDPADPDDGNSIQWVSDGTGSGDAGDVIIKTNVGGTVKMHIISPFNILT